MEYHPVAALFPMMSDEEHRALVEDIRAHGLREAIWTYEGKIIDGRNRYRACLEAGVEPRFRVWDGNGSLVAFVVSLNVQRRHLNSGQKAVIALEIEKQLAVEAKERQIAALKQNASPQPLVKKLTNGDRNDGKASAQAAALVGTNRQYVSDAKKIDAVAPALTAEVLKGTITLKDAKHLSRMDETRRAPMLKAIQSGDAKDLHGAYAAAKRYHRDELVSHFWDLADEEPDLLQYAEAVKKEEIKIVRMGVVIGGYDDRETLLEVQDLTREFTGQMWHWPRYSGTVITGIQPHRTTLIEDLDVPLFTPEEWAAFTAFDEQEELEALDFDGSEYFNWDHRAMRVMYRASNLRPLWSADGVNQRDYDPLFGRVITPNTSCGTCPAKALFIRRGWGEWCIVEFNDGAGGREQRRYFRHDHAGATFIQQATETVDPFAFSQANFKNLRIWQVQTLETSWFYIRRKTIAREDAIAALEADLVALRNAAPLSDDELTERALDWLQAYTPDHPDRWREGVCTWPRRDDGTVDVEVFNQWMNKAQA